MLRRKLNDTCWSNEGELGIETKAELDSRAIYSRTMDAEKRREVYTQRDIKGAFLLEPMPRDSGGVTS